MSAKAVAAPCSEDFTPAKVHVLPGLLNDIAHLVLDAYAAAPHGGLEVGGLLFGRRSAGFISVEDFLPLSCDHSSGPRFILSEHDERGLCELLKSPAIDPTLQGLDVIGWYCSHTRSDLLLFDREVALHETYFSDPLDFVVVFKPRDQRSVTAGIFLRGADHMMDPRRPVTILDMLELSAPRTVARHGNDPAGLSSQAASRIANEGPSSSSDLPSAIEPAASHQSIRKLQAVIAHASAKLSQQSRRAVKWNILLAAAGVIALLCFAAWLDMRVTQVHPADLSLSLRPSARNLLLSWKSNVSRPHRARVDILDGTSIQHLNITDIFQPSGLVLFPRNTANVQAVLTIETGNGLLVRHAGFTDLSAPVKDQVVSEKSSEGSAPTNLSPSNPAANHAGERQARRTHHKNSLPAKTNPRPKQLQANQSP